MFDKGIIGWMMDINPTKYTVKNQKMVNCIFESQYHLQWFYTNSLWAFFIIMFIFFFMKLKNNADNIKPGKLHIKRNDNTATTK